MLCTDLCGCPRFLRLAIQLAIDERNTLLRCLGKPPGGIAGRRGNGQQHALGVFRLTFYALFSNVVWEQTRGFTIFIVLEFGSLSLKSGTVALLEQTQWMLTGFIGRGGGRTQVPFGSHDTKECCLASTYTELGEYSMAGAALGC